MRNGLLIRTAVRRRSLFSIITPHTFCRQVIGAIFRKSLRLSGSARMEHSVGKITTMISADATRLDRFSAFIHKYAFVLRLIYLTYRFTVYGWLRFRFGFLQRLPSSPAKHPSRLQLASAFS